MKTVREEARVPTLAQTIAGEDLETGDFVAVLSRVSEIPPYFWDCSAMSGEPAQMVRLKYIPDEAGRPCKVIGICLPFVYITRPHGEVECLDLRLTQLVRLNAACAKHVWKKLRRASSKNSATSLNGIP